MASLVAMTDLEAHLAEVLARVEGGEEIVVERDGRPALKMMPVEPVLSHGVTLPRELPTNNPFHVVLYEGWDDPMTEEELAEWGM